MLAVAVGAVRIDGFFKTMSGYELEKLGKDGIIMPWFKALVLKLSGLAIP